jgi:hypothetical protein
MTTGVPAASGRDSSAASFVSAMGVGERAARREQAARGPVELARHHARDRGQAARAGAFGQRVQQRGGVGVVRVGEQRHDVVGLHLAAGVLHDDAVGVLGDEAQVVGDQHQRHAAFALEREQQVEDLGLDGDVERGGGLVGDQQLGLAGQRHRDHHALAHAARELVRERGGAARGVGDADLFEQFQRALAARLAIQPEMHLEHLADLVADREARVQRGDRLLEDHRDVAADDRAPLLRGDPRQVVAVEGHAIGRDGGRPRQQPHQRQHRDGLARAGLADDGQHLVGLDLQIDAVDRDELAAAGVEGDAHVPDVKKRHVFVSAEGCSAGQALGQRGSLPEPNRAPPRGAATGGAWGPS